MFNIEGGCYAKAINLSKEKEPQIYNAIEYGTILENTVVKEDGTVDFDDNKFTENTRAASLLNILIISFYLLKQHIQIQLFS